MPLPTHHHSQNRAGLSQVTRAASARLSSSLGVSHLAGGSTPPHTSPPSPRHFSEVAFALADRDFARREAARLKFMMGGAGE